MPPVAKHFKTSSERTGKEYQYGKNGLTLQRYLGYHNEIQGLIGK